MDDLIGVHLIALMVFCFVKFPQPAAHAEQTPAPTAEVNRIKKFMRVALW
jgi:hypothetical protein